MDSLLSLKEGLVIFASYALGCIATGYYLVRLRTGKDIRGHGSGSVGATNVGRDLGPLWFAATFLIDFAKGAMAVWVAYHFGLGPSGVVAAMNAVVIGHIWPVQLGLRGGKGIATGLGAFLMYDLRLTMVLLLTFGVMLAVLRKFTLSGVLSLVLSPIFAALLGRSKTEVLGIAILAVLVLIAHRENIKAILIKIEEKTA